MSRTLLLLLIMTLVLGADRVARADAETEVDAAGLRAFAESAIDAIAANSYEALAEHQIDASRIQALCPAIRSPEALVERLVQITPAEALAAHGGADAVRSQLEADAERQHAKLLDRLRRGNEEGYRLGKASTATEACAATLAAAPREITSMRGGEPREPYKLAALCGDVARDFTDLEVTVTAGGKRAIITFEGLARVEGDGWVVGDGIRCTLDP